MMFILESESEKKLKWVRHTHAVLMAGQQFLSAMKDAETGQRGYLLTQDVKYLAPYHHGRELAESLLRRLQYLTRDNAQQQKRLQEVAQQVQLKLAELAETIELAQQGHPQDALKIVHEDVGQRYMDRIREIMGQFVRTEELLLAQREGDYRETRARIIMVIAFEAVVFLGLVLVTFFFMRRNLMQPLSTLLKIVRETRANRKARIENILPQDEMSYLIANVYEMNQVVVERSRSLELRAQRDVLTGLFNRHAMDEMMPEMLQEVTSQGERLALIYVDLDKFKPINDTLGHECGDQVLVEISNRMRSVLRAQDRVFRLGGDEFLVTVVFEEDEQLRHVLSRLCEALNQPMILKDQTVTLSASLGVALAPDMSSDLTTLLQMADQAMYRAKHSGECYRLVESGDGAKA